MASRVMPTIAALPGAAQTPAKPTVPSAECGGHCAAARVIRQSGLMTVLLGSWGCTAWIGFAESNQS
jgi:hypothetical protein